MGDNHWSDDEFIDRLYGLGPEGSHLEECPQCRRRWGEFRLRRSQILEAPAVSEEFLVAQRHAVYRKIEEGVGQWWNWSLIPGFAGAAVMILLAVLVSGPKPATLPEISADVQLADVYSAVQQMEPAAVEPIQGLFEVNP